MGTDHAPCNSRNRTKTKRAPRCHRRAVIATLSPDQPMNPHPTHPLVSTIRVAARGPAHLKHTSRLAALVNPGPLVLQLPAAVRNRCNWGRGEWLASGPKLSYIEPRQQVQRRPAASADIRPSPNIRLSHHLTSCRMQPAVAHRFLSR